MRWLGLPLVVAFMLVAASPAAAETFTVTSTVDSTGPCSGTACPSIRRALAAAEGSGGPDTIAIPAGDYQLTLGALDVDSPVTIRGAGAHATRVLGDAQLRERVFTVAGVSAVISSLTASGGRAPVGTFGGNVSNGGGDLVLDHVRLTLGEADAGGGVSNSEGTLTIAYSLIDENQAFGQGAGWGGGILNAGSDSLGITTVRDSTVTGNEASFGGGVFALGATVTALQRVTVEGNDTGSQGNGGGIGSVPAGQTFTVQGSILARNTGDGVAGPFSCATPAPASGGGNVVSSGECGFAAAGDVQSTDPQLGATLVDAGGQTDLFTIAATSPALDRVPGCSGADQRDLARPQGSACDSGAYEIDQPEPPSPPSPPQPSPPVTPQQPEPEFHETVVIGKVRGTVRVRLKGRRRFVTLDGSRSIPLGSTVDVKKGVVELTSEPGRSADPETARFYAGIFRVTQPGRITQLRLSEALAKCTSGRASAAARKAKKRRLWGDGKGKFRTKGSYSSATVRGTKWLVSDSCAGTLTRVVSGVVSVRDRVRRKTIRVRAGKRYLARPPG